MQIEGERMETVTDFIWGGGGGVKNQGGGGGRGGAVQNHGRW